MLSHIEWFKLLGNFEDRVSETFPTATVLEISRRYFWSLLRSLGNFFYRKFNGVGTNCITNIFSQSCNCLPIHPLKHVGPIIFSTQNISNNVAPSWWLVAFKIISSEFIFLARAVSRVCCHSAETNISGPPFDYFSTERLWYNERSSKIKRIFFHCKKHLNTKKLNFIFVSDKWFICSKS